MTTRSLVPVSLAASSEVLRREVLRIAELAGIDPLQVDASNDDAAVLRLVEEPASHPVVRASFHPSYAAYFSSGSVSLSLPEEAEDLLELVLAAGSTARGDIVGVVGAAGGVGASTIACWLARAAGDDVTLVDLDPASAGLDAYLGTDGAEGIRWADIGPGGGVLIPGRLTHGLPRRAGLRVLSGDERGGVPVRAPGNSGAHSANQGGPAERAIDAVSQASALTILDFPPEATVAGTAANALLGWCDVVVLVCGGAEHQMRAGGAAIRRLAAGGGPRPVVAARVAGRGACAAAEERLGVERVLAVRRLRGLEADLDHGMAVGDRKRSGTGRDVAELLAAVRAELA